jgi:hypothetical protein
MPAKSEIYNSSLRLGVFQNSHTQKSSYTHSSAVFTTSTEELGWGRSLERITAFDLQES